MEVKNKIGIRVVNRFDYHMYDGNSIYLGVYIKARHINHNRYGIRLWKEIN
jgi:hypothetical protein